MKCKDKGYDNPPPINPYYYAMPTVAAPPIPQQQAVSEEAENQVEPSCETNE